MDFKLDPVRFIEGKERPRALASLRSYYTRYTGRFFDLHPDPDPYHFTERDILRVGLLGVVVPPKAVARILYEDPEPFAALLDADVLPADQAIWDGSADLGPDGAAWQLWDALKMRGMGRTIRSKLLAAKRPNLIPVYDQYVGDALLRRDADDWWQGWSVYLPNPDGGDLRESTEALRHEAELDSVPVLRVLDVVIWMRTHGWKDDPQLHGLGYDVAV